MIIEECPHCRQPLVIPCRCGSLMGLAQKAIQKDLGGVCTHWVCPHCGNLTCSRVRVS
jgi:hypothetical protein